jgi:phosphate transport system permease protein
MSPTGTIEPPPADPGKRAPRSKRERRPRRATSLFANGEPWIWLTGGSLALALLMILGLLTLVLAKGLPTFWPARVVRITTLDGRTVMGEVDTSERYRPEPQLLERLPEPVLERARELLEAQDGESGRLRLRTGNFDLTNTHYTWISDFEIATQDRPDWALVVERLEWGRFYGFPQAILIDGEETRGDPARIWALFEQHHPDVRQRWRERRSLETHDVGRVSARQEKARLARDTARLEHGQDSAAWRAADERFQAVQAEANREFERISAEIGAINEVNARYQLVLAAADGQEKTLGLADVVRAYPANPLGLGQRLGVYASRLAEFLVDEPRNANQEGGVYPAIFGTVAMTLIMSILVVPFGVLAALYLREYAKQGPIVSTVRIAVNNLAGVPSIVFGVFGLGFFCYIIGARVDELFFAASLPNPTYAKGGLLWASLTLALLTLPVVIVPSEEALAAVPGSMREGSYACGATKWQTIRRIVLPRALPGIMTGMILAIARGAGEVAPLMLVGAVDKADDLPLDGVPPYIHPQRSFMHLGYHIYDLGFMSQNSEAAKPMVYTTTVLLIGIVVVLNLLAIWVRGRLRRRFTSGA